MHCRRPAVSVRLGGALVTSQGHKLAVCTTSKLAHKGLLEQIKRAGSREPKGILDQAVRVCHQSASNSWSSRSGSGKRSTAAIPVS